MITQFDGPFAFLSNFYPLDDGLTIEHLFQARKAKLGRDRVAIVVAPAPGKAKRLGRLVLAIDHWEAQRDHEMLDLLRYKFGKPALRARLLATGRALLVENNRWHDNCWGSCTCSHCGDRGQNRLGQMLMQVRSEYEFWQVAEGGHTYPSPTLFGEQASWAL